MDGCQCVESSLLTPCFVFTFRATHVQNEDGSVVLLNPHNPRQRQAIAFKLLAPGKEGDTAGATKKVCYHDSLLSVVDPGFHVWHGGEGACQWHRGEGACQCHGGEGACQWHRGEGAYQCHRGEGACQWHGGEGVCQCFLPTGSMHVYAMKMWAWLHYKSYHSFWEEGARDIPPVIESKLPSLCVAAHITVWSLATIREFVLCYMKAALCMCSDRMCSDRALYLCVLIGHCTYVF